MLDAENDDALAFVVTRVRHIWHVRRHGARRSCGRFATRDAAVHFAAELVAQHPTGGTVVIRDGPERTDTLVLQEGELGAEPPPRSPAAPQATVRHATRREVHIAHHARRSPSRRLPAW